MTTVRISVDSTRPLASQPEVGHNRWHPLVPPIALVASGDTLEMGTRDALDGQIGPSTLGAELFSLDYGACHPLTGPVCIGDAAPGDVVAVTTRAISTSSFGWTFVAPGAGLLADDPFDPFVFHWTLDEGVARSEDIPGVAVPGAPFLGIVGVAPSLENLEHYRAREEAAAERGLEAAPPSAASAIPPGNAPATDGLNTQPPRENGGNLDVRHLAVGSTLLLPVQVEGALLSIGDMHFAQGDGESCITAIETTGTATLDISVRKRATLDFQLRMPSIELCSQPPASSGPWFATTGIPHAQSSETTDDRALLAARDAVRQMIDYLVATRGYTREQAYAIVSVCVDLHLSAVVNSPNPLVTAILPLGVFEDP